MLNNFKAICTRKIKWIDRKQKRICRAKVVDTILLRRNIAARSRSHLTRKFMELKVLCGCGTKYKFDVEPVGGRMPVRVTCPSCGVDGTDTANNLLTQHLPSQSSAIPVAMVAAVPVMSGLRINSSAPAIAPAGNIPIPPPVPSAPKPIGQKRPATLHVSKPKTEAYNLWLGILGACLGAALGAGLMYGFFVATGFRFPLMGTCIGALSGLGARILARGTDMTLGIAAGAIALLSTAGTLFLMFGNEGGLFIISMAVSVYFAYRVAA